MSKATILGYVGEVPSIVDADADLYLAEALAIYSRHRPYRRAKDVAGEDANLLTTPTGWVDGSSLLTRVVYPYEDEDSDELVDDDWVIDAVPSGGVLVEKIRFLAHEPASTETVRLWYQTPHTLSDATSTVYAQDEPAFSRLVKSLIYRDAASKYLHLKDQGVDAQLVDYGAKANEARATAKEHYAAYLSGMGVGAKDEPIKATAIGGDVDTDPQYQIDVGGPYMTHHRRRYR